MGEVLVHHGILGQKWGVRRFQNKDGSLTKAGKERYDVGNDKTNPGYLKKSRESVQKYKNRYAEYYNALKKEYRYNTNFDADKSKSSLTQDVFSIYVSMLDATVYDASFTGDDVGLDFLLSQLKAKPLRMETMLFEEAGSLIGLKTSIDDISKLYDALNSGDFSNANVDDAIKLIAAFRSYQEMPNQYWLPSIAEYDQENEENKQRLNDLMTALNNAGLNGIAKIEGSIKDPMYVIEYGGRKNYFEPDQIKEMQQFALKNDLFSKDYRTTTNAQRTREKNIDASSGPKAVVKREKIDVSDKERVEKEASSKASDEAAAKKLWDAVKAAQVKKKTANKKSTTKEKRLGHSDQSTQDILVHHGILNQKWGVRNGPPYPLGGGDYSPSEKKAIKGQRRLGNSIYNKKHFDEVLKKDKTTLSTLSYDENRTKNTDMFYATHDIWDKHQYNALFNRKIPKTLYDDSGTPIGTGTCLKFRIDNSLKSDIKVASEDSGAKIFKNLYKKDRDFYNFVTDPSRMEDYFVKDKYKFKGYQEAGKVLKKMRSSNYNPTENDVQTLYRMFNYVIPYDGQGNARKGGDVAKQRAKFFKELKDAGYGAVLDTNDAIYGGFKAKSPVIVFDMDQIIPKDVYQTTMSDKAVSEAALALRKLLRQ